MERINNILKIVLISTFLFVIVATVNVKSVYAKWVGPELIVQDKQEVYQRNFKLDYSGNLHLIDRHKNAIFKYNQLALLSKNGFKMK